MASLNIEIEEIEIQAEELSSILLLYEQALLYNQISAETFRPAVTHMTILSDSICEKLKVLRERTSKELKEKVLKK